VSDNTPDLAALEAADKEAKEAVKAAKKALDADKDNADLKKAHEDAKAAAKTAADALKAAKPAPEPKGPKAVPVYSPNRSYTGTTAGVAFVNGNGEIPATDNQAHLVSWFKNRGYKVGGEAPKAAE